MPTASTLPTAPDGPTGQLATWIAGFTLDQAPPDVQERAKHLLLDGFGCALVGAQVPWTRTAVETVTAFEGKGDTPIIGWGATTGAAAAAVLNGACIRALELSGDNALSYSHDIAVMIPAMLSVAHLDPTITGARFVGAAIVGCESGTRAAMGLHGGKALLLRGWHVGPVIGNVTAAAAMANILGLNAAQTEDALGHGCTQSFGLAGTSDGADSQRILAGWSSRNGLYAALLAKAGYTGIKQVFELSYGGWLSTFGEGQNPDSTQIASELGKRWDVLLAEIIKPYSCNGSLDCAVEALFDINDKRHLKAAEIASIDFDMSTGAFEHSWWGPLKRPITIATAQLNLAYVAAVAVLDGEVLVKQFTPSCINSDDVWDLIPRINAHIDAAFDKDTDPSHNMQTRARIRFTDGTELDSYRVAPKMVTPGISNDEIVTKFRNVTDGIIDSDRQSRIEETILDLDKQYSLEALVELLARPVKSPF
jgi:2-methylcitrate dehydratase PrpD